VSFPFFVAFVPFVFHSVRPPPVAVCCLPNKPPRTAASAVTCEFWIPVSFNFVSFPFFVSFVPFVSHSVVPPPVISRTLAKNARLRSLEMPQLTGTLW